MAWQRFPPFDSPTCIRRNFSSFYIAGKLAVCGPNNVDGLLFATTWQIEATEQNLFGNSFIDPSYRHLFRAGETRSVEQVLRSSIAHEGSQ